MTTPGQNQVVRELVALDQDLDVAAADMARIDMELTRATARHEVRFAQAFLSEDNTGAEGKRKQEAILRTKDEKFAMEVLAAQLRAAKANFARIRDKIEVRRSLGAAVRAEWAAQGSSMHPG